MLIVEGKGSMAFSSILPPLHLHCCLCVCQHVQAKHLHLSVLVTAFIITGTGKCAICLYCPAPILQHCLFMCLPEMLSDANGSVYKLCTSCEQHSHMLGNLLFVYEEFACVLCCARKPFVHVSSCTVFLQLPLLSSSNTSPFCLLFATFFKHMQYLRFSMRAFQMLGITLCSFCLLTWHSLIGKPGELSESGIIGTCRFLLCFATAALSP